MKNRGTFLGADPNGDQHVADSSNDGSSRAENANDNKKTGEHSAFVGDLPPEVNDFALQEVFTARYKSVRNARVVTDPRTGRSKGFGFVRFGKKDDRDKAMTEMNGVKCGSRTMRISLAVPRKNQTGESVLNKYGPDVTPSGMSTPSAYGVQTPVNDQSPERDGRESSGSQSESRVDGSESNNSQSNTESSIPPPATGFVGGIDPSVREHDLREKFSEFGKLTYVKIPKGKGCGFVQFVERGTAEQAIEKLNGVKVGMSGCKMRVSWVRSNTRDTSDRLNAHIHDMHGMHGAQFYPQQYGNLGYPMGSPLGMDYSGLAHPALYYPAPGGGFMMQGGGWVPGGVPTGGVLAGEDSGQWEAQMALAQRMQYEQYAAAMGASQMAPEYHPAAYGQQSVIHAEPRFTPNGPSPPPPPTPSGVPKHAPHAGGGAAA